MRLRILTPTEVVVDEAIAKLRAEAEDGSFGMLPHHVDFVAALVPGVLAYVPAEGEVRECFVAIDEGVLVKCGDEVRVSVRRAAVGALHDLPRELARELRELDEHERQARSAVARLEAAAVRRFAEIGETGHG